MGFEYDGDGNRITKLTAMKRPIKEEIGTDPSLKPGKDKGQGKGKNKVGGYWTNDGKLVTFWD